MVNNSNSDITPGSWSNKPDSDVILGSWTLVIRTSEGREHLCDILIEQLQWVMGGEVYYAVVEDEVELRKLYEKLKAKFDG